MEKTFMLEIITPEKQFFTGEVESLIIPAVDGSYGVQAGHEPIVTAIEPGEARYKVDGVWHTAVVTQGFAEIMSDYAVVLVATAERPEDIDANRAKQAEARAREELLQKRSQMEYRLAQANLARALNRLRISGEHKH